MEASSETVSGDSAASGSRWGRATSDDAGEDGREALSELAASYYYCVYAWWRRAGREAEAAAAATLASFGRWLGEAPPRRTDSGSERMRTWLLERLVELSGEALEAPAAPPIAFDPRWVEVRYADEPPGEADAIFQRRWALTVLEFTVATMSAEYAARGEEKLFPELVPFAGFDSGAEDRYAAAAARIGRTVGAMHKEVFDFRHRQRELLLFFAGDSLLDPAEAQSEITAMLCACDAPGPEAAAARLPTAISNVHPDEMLARAMQSVRMTGGGADGWQPPTVEEASRLFPQYEVTALLGRGGMGAVYQGRQTELDRLVAIKLLPLEVSVDRDFADRFRREARAMARLQHPNIIDVHDFGTTAEGHLFFVMEYVDGANLDAMIRGPGLAPAQALEIIGSVCDALAYAHAEGVVHRDIKPANVMVSTKGRVKVADFGLARLTDSGPEQLGHTVTGTVMGTPDYMAPEQKRGMNVDHRADIYSLGVMLYEMLCREVPQGIFDPPSHRVAVDSRVDQVVIKAMHQQPDRRFQSTQEMKTAVTEASVPQPRALALARLPLGGMSRAMTMFAPGAAPRSKQKPLFAGLGVLAIGATALFYLQPWKKSAPPSPSPAPQVAAPPTGPGTPGALTKTAAFGPWQPLFTDAEWKQTIPGKREAVDGRVHLTGPSATKPQLAADGAIRARLQCQQGMKFVGFEARKTTEGGLYKAQVESERSVVLEYYPPGATTGADRKLLGKYDLPKPLQPGDTLLLELRLQGDRLTVLTDGAVVIEARDSRAPGPGQWGIIANDGWFESVEVQTPLPAPADGWEDLVAKLTPELVAQTGHGWRLEGGVLHSADKDYTALPLPGSFAGTSYQTRVKFRNRQIQRVDSLSITLPVADRMTQFILDGYWKGIWSGLQMVNGMPFREVPGAVNWRQVNDDRTHDLEVTVRLEGANAKITVALDARPSFYEWVGSIASLSLHQNWATTPPGSLALGANKEDWEFSEVKAKRLDSGASAPPAAATKTAPFVNSLGMKFVPVPIVGRPTAGQRVLFGVWDVRVQDYAAYAKAQESAGKKVDGAWKTQNRDGVTEGRELDHPVVGVSWEDAQAFCQWLTEKESAEGKLPKGVRYRLPGDEEWSWAVGMPPEVGGTPEEKNGKNSVDFPWGKDWPPTRKVGNYADETFHAKFPKQPTDRQRDQPWIEGYTDGYATTSPVGSFPANAYGLYDLGGNVWQWCEDWWNAEHKDRVLRGGSWGHYDRGNLLSSLRFHFAPGQRYGINGFRCVLEVPAPPTAASAPPAAAADGWEDVFAKLTPEIVAQTGHGWSLKDGELFSPATDAALPLPGHLSGASYQVRVKLRKLVVKDSVHTFHVVLPVGDRMTGFELEGFSGQYTGLMMVDGKKGPDVPGVVKGKQVNDSEPHELEVTVRLDGANATITTTLDTRPLYQWTGPTATLSQHPSWAFTKPGTLTLGTLAGGWAVSEVKAKRLGEGK